MEENQYVIFLRGGKEIIISQKTFEYIVGTINNNSPFVICKEGVFSKKKIYGITLKK